eukprot:7399215-Ditylum_brightwellii.AAC.1
MTKETKEDDDRTQTEKLIDDLCYGANHNKKKGWRHQQLNIDPDTKKRKCNSGFELIKNEIQQLWMEVTLLEEYKKVREISKKHNVRGKKSGKFIHHKKS